MGLEVLFTCESTIFAQTHFKCSVHGLPAKLLLQVIKFIEFTLVRCITEIILRQVRILLAGLELRHLDLRRPVHLSLSSLLFLLLAAPAGG